MGIDAVTQGFRIKIFMDGADIEPMKAAHKAGKHDESMKHLGEAKKMLGI